MPRPLPMTRRARLAAVRTSAAVVTHVVVGEPSPDPGDAVEAHPPAPTAGTAGMCVAARAHCGRSRRRATPATRGASRRPCQRLRVLEGALARGVAGDKGQTTAEYALVILAAGTLALAAILWARDSGSITDLFEDVVERLTGDL